MAAVVTVPGTSSGNPVTISSGPGDVRQLANQIGQVLSTIQTSTVPGALLSVTNDTVSGSIPSLGTAEAFLHGPSANYVIANNGGSPFVSDDQPLRDGTQILPGDTLVAFTDGLGLFDPTGAAENISRLYYGILGRAPDLAGLEAWTALVNNSNVSLNTIAGDLISSPEFQNLGTLSNLLFVTKLYSNALGRPPVLAEQTAWTNALMAGTSRGAVAVAIAESAEGKAHSLSNETAGDNNSGEIYRLYETVFGRSPDPAGGAGWASALAVGSTIGQVAQAFVGSSEFQQLYGTSSPQAFVTSLYQNALNRTPGPAELAAWVGMLKAGASQASVIVGISDSSESRDDTGGATHANWVFLPSPPPTTELILGGGGGLNTTVPGGYDYIVANGTTLPETLTVANAVIVANTVGGTFNVSGISTVAATGASTVNATGQYDLSFGPGTSKVLAAGSGTISAGGPTTVTVTGSNDLILAGTSAMTIAAGNASGLTVDGGSGPLQFVGGAAPATIFGGSGGSTVTFGTGGGAFTTAGASDVASLAGGSTSTIFGSTGSNLSVAGAGNLDYVAASGSTTLNAASASGNDSVYLGSNQGADAVTLGSGSNTITAGSGSETLQGGSGGNLYLFNLGQTSGNGNIDSIRDSAANIANDTFSFVNYAGLPTETVTGGQVEVTLSDKTKVLFTQLSSLSQSLGHINILNSP